MREKSYLLFGITLAISLVLMFLISYVQIVTWDHFYLALANFYMALVMVAVMGLVMLAVMHRMFTNKALTVATAAVLVILGVGGYLMGREQTFVGNEAFLKSMIPHHSRAVLVCKQAHITDPQIKSLCKEIIRSQQREIDEMQRIMKDRY